MIQSAIQATHQLLVPLDVMPLFSVVHQVVLKKLKKAQTKVQETYSTLSHVLPMLYRSQVGFFFCLLVRLGLVNYFQSPKILFGDSLQIFVGYQVFREMLLILQQWLALMITHGRHLFYRSCLVA